MRLVLLLLAGFSALLLVAPAAKAGPNAAMCFAVQTQYNECVRHQRRHRQWDGDDDDWGGPQRRRGDPCAGFIYQLKQMGCF